MTRASAIAFVVLVAALSGSCRGRTLAPGDTSPVLVGVLLPQSGNLGADGMTWLAGIQVAVAEVNAAGGVLPGRRVELVIEDSETKRDTSVMRAQALVDRGVAAIIGDASSSASLADYTMVTQMARVPQNSC